MIDEATKTVRDLALEMPHATRVFEKLGIDYCCGGAKPLARACEEAKLPIEEVLRLLKDAEIIPEPSSTLEWRKSPLSNLIDHIVEKHHRYVKGELPRLEGLLAKVASAHGQNHPEVPEIQAVFAGVSEELTRHMMKEERILFPYLKQMEEARARGRQAPHAMFGTVENPIAMMTMEHDSAGVALKKIHQLSGDFTAPPDACISFRTLYQVLAEFEADLHEHIHLENNILFPRAVEMEK